MPVDVLTDIVINRPRDEVAAYASDLDNATEWLANVKYAVEWKSLAPATVGSRIAFVTHFLGRRLAYTAEIRELVPGRRFVLGIVEGPFSAETTYTWEDTDGGTRMTMCIRSEPSGFYRIAAPMMAAMARRGMRKDLERLKSILEK